ncbi:hypothetical protein CPC08DRAFT_712808 [Agrocybe pediades]|nr:hypothetical protein CPC08DRAFT_712808 [Agrocybe pediades]
MPPRIPRTYHIQVKTHKLTIMLSSLPPSTKIAEMKSETLSALKSDVAVDALDVLAMEPPPDLKVETEDDFELCRAKRERGKPTGEYEILDPTKTIKECNLTGWEAIFLQPKDEDGNLLPITYTLPSLYDEEYEQPPPVNKGKRKAPADD